MILYCSHGIMCNIAVSVSLFYARATTPAKLRLPDHPRCQVVLDNYWPDDLFPFQRIALRKGDLRTCIGQDLLHVYSTLLVTVGDSSETGRWNEGCSPVDVAHQCTARFTIPGPAREFSFRFRTHWQTTRRFTDAVAVSISFSRL